MFAFLLNDEGVRFLKHLPEIGIPTVDELGSEFDRSRGARIVLRQDTAANAIARFEHHRTMAARFQFAGGGQSGDSGSDDEDFAHP
jgi:hypothetical protein